MSEDFVPHPDHPTAREAMTESLVTFRADQDLWEAIEVLLDMSISGAPVVDDDGNLVGVLSEQDCLALYGKGTPDGLPEATVGETMSPVVVTIPVEMSLFTVASLFRHNPYRRLPVVSVDTLVGQISRRDLLAYMKTIGRLDATD